MSTGTDEAALGTTFRVTIGEIPQEIYSGTNFHQTESLSDENFAHEHEALKTKLGDSQYIAFRQAEISAKMETVAQHIVAHDCLRPLENPQPDEVDIRLVTRDGHSFKIGKGVPTHASEAMRALWDRNWNYEDDAQLPSLESIPEEFLKYEVTQEERAREQEDEQTHARQRATVMDENILRGELSVRDVRLPCSCRNEL